MYGVLASIDPPSGAIIRYSKALGALKPTHIGKLEFYECGTADAVEDFRKWPSDDCRIPKGRRLPLILAV